MDRMSSDQISAVRSMSNVGPGFKRKGVTVTLFLIVGVPQVLSMLKTVARTFAQMRYPYVDPA